MPLRVYCATHFTHLAVSRHGAISASVLVSKLPDTLSLDYHSRREYHVIEDNISRAIGTYLCLSLRFVPRSHFILHFAFCILHFALAQPCLSLRFVPRSHFILHSAFCILHFAFCILHWQIPAFHFHFSTVFNRTDFRPRILSGGFIHF